MKNILYVFSGVIFGIVMFKSEAISWFRIQEMFRFQAFHMYGIMGSAVVVGASFVAVLRRLGMNSITGEPMKFSEKKKLYKSPLIGGVIFGLGWAMTGACPGPLFVNVGAGYSVMLVVIGFAALGAFVHGLIAHRLPR